MRVVRAAETQHCNRQVLRAAEEGGGPGGTRRVPKTPPHTQFPDDKNLSSPTPGSSPGSPAGPRCSRRRRRWARSPGLCMEPAEHARNLLPPGAGSIWNGLPSACTYHAPPSTQAWQLGRVSGWDATRVLLAILTKKSKLKRKRKYLMTLTQADPILRPWSSLWREEAGRSGQGGTGRGRREREPMLVGANHLTTTHGGSTNVMSHFMAL